MKGVESIRVKSVRVEGFCGGNRYSYIRYSLSVNRELLSLRTIPRACERVSEATSKAAAAGSDGLRRFFDPSPVFPCESSRCSGFSTRKGARLAVGKTINDGGLSF